MKITPSQNRLYPFFTRCLFLLGLLGWNVLPAAAQNASLDSLTRLLEAHPQKDTTRVNLLNEVAMAQWNVQPDRTAQLAKEALALAQHIDFQKGIAASHHALGVAHWLRGEYEKASEVAFAALRIYQTLENPAGVAKVYTLLGLIYDEYRQLDKSIEYHTQALQQQEAIDNQAGIATAANNIGAVYYKKEEYDKALDYFFRALEIRQTLRNQRAIAETLSNIGGVYRAKEQYDQALAYVQRAIDLRKNINDPNGAIPALQQLAGIYRGTKQLDLAEAKYLEALELANRLGIPKRQQEIYNTLSALKKEKGEYAPALQYYERYIEKRDSLQSQEAAAHLAELEAQYQTERQEQQIALLQRDNRIKTIIRNVLILSVLLLIAGTIALYQFFNYRNRKNQALLQAEQALAQQLQEVDKLKSRFFANISHEFRTPLTLILEPVEELLTRTTDEHARELLRMLQRNAHRLLNLINQLLELSKIEAGKLELRAAPSNIVAYLRLVVNTFHSLAERRGIVLEFAAPTDDLLLFFDREKIEQVFNNLIYNALKFVPRGGSVEVALQTTTRDGRAYVQVDVRDTGIGIEPSYLPYIFDRFYHIGHSNIKALEGTGIGLALAKELVELHQGNILVQSEKGKGTTFTVLLPMGKEHLREEQLVRAAPVEPLAPVKPLLEATSTQDLYLPNTPDKPTILLVEDNADLQLFISQTLAKDYTVQTVGDGQAGLERALELTPDLVISDVMMPRMDGFTLCKHLKTDERTSHIPIILLTAKNAEEDKLQGWESLADDYLMKPFNTRELLARIKNLILSRKNLQGKFTGNIILKPKEVEVPSVEKVFFEKLMQVIEENMENEDFGIEALSRAMNMSRSQLHRKLVALTDQTPSQLVRSYRLQRAQQLLQQNAGNIADIAFQVGFSNPAYFTKVFTEEFGYSPREWRQQNAN